MCLGELLSASSSEIQTKNTFKVLSLNLSNMQSLFPSNVGSQPGGAAPLMQFPAGKCVLTPSSNGKFTVTADPRRGSVSISKGSDGLVHFKWTVQNGGSAEDDRMVFPGENVFKRVKTGRENDRVFMLQYITGNQRLMYWMQEKADTNDEKYVKEINEFINNPGGAGGVVPGASTTVGQNEWNQMIGLVYTDKIFPIL